jgi:hypothetical protein
MVTSHKLKCYEKTKNILHGIFRDDKEKSTQLDLTTARNVICQETYVNSVDLDNIAQQLRSEEPSVLSVNEEYDVQQFPSVTPLLHAEDNHSKLSNRLNSTQKIVWEEIRHHFQCLRLFKNGMGPKPSQLRIF